MLKIWGPKIKGLQSYWPSNFENDSTSGDLELGPKPLADSSAVKAEAFVTMNFQIQGLQTRNNSF